MTTVHNRVRTFWAETMYLKFLLQIIDNGGWSLFNRYLTDQSSFMNDTRSLKRAVEDAFK